MPRKPKKKTIKNKLRKLVHEIVKHRDGNICQKCGQYCEGRNAHPSHVIPVSKSRLLQFDVTNIKVLCFRCHIMWWHKEPTDAGDWFKEKFPERWEYLDPKKELEDHRTVDDLIELHEAYLQLAKQIGIR